jgi:hypothetical protein
MVIIYMMHTGTENSISGIQEVLKPSNSTQRHPAKINNVNRVLVPNYKTSH